MSSPACLALHQLQKFLDHGTKHFYKSKKGKSLLNEVEVSASICVRKGSANAKDAALVLVSLHLPSIGQFKVPEHSTRTPQARTDTISDSLAGLQQDSAHIQVCMASSTFSLWGFSSFNV